MVVDPPDHPTIAEIARQSGCGYQPVQERSDRRAASEHGQDPDGDRQSCGRFQGFSRSKSYPAAKTARAERV